MRWTAGSGVGYTWSNAFNSSDIASLQNGSSVLSSVADITNQTSQDLFMDVSIRLTLGTATAIGSGAFVGLFLFPLLDDGATYGDGSLVAGTQAAVTPGVTYVGAVPFRQATYTVMAGAVLGIWIPPGSFRLAVQNNTGVRWSTAANSICKYRTYNINPSS